MKNLIVLLFIVSGFVASAQKFQNLALTPPMGWNSWNKFQCNVSEELMSRMLKEAGHPIVFSLCEWGGSKPWEWAAEVGHLWRTTGDIAKCFDCEQKHPGYSNWGVTKILDMQKDMRQYAGPGHWNDPDMLQVGNGGMTVNEDRAHFTMWCMLAAPLIRLSLVK